MKPPKCRLCDHEHWGLDHVFATNKSDVKSDDATNKGRVREEVTRKRAAPVETAASVVTAHGEAKTKNRRSKEAYNAYQREYMRKRRAARGKEV